MKPHDILVTLKMLSLNEKAADGSTVWPQRLLAKETGLSLPAGRFARVWRDWRLSGSRLAPTSGPRRERRAARVSGVRRSGAW